jgi:hypothetical protein
MLIYWGCGDKVRRPTARSGYGQGQSDGFCQDDVLAPAHAPVPLHRVDWTYSEWPNRENQLACPGQLVAG